ncbi:MAG: hypothetical protein AAF662_00100 [Pseudomonadota bacterium]
MALQGVEDDGAVGGSLLILAPHLHSIPAAVIHDATLSPVDRLAWMVIFQAAVEGGGTAAFPSYRSLTTTANLGSSATVSRALASLRILRWMTVSRRKAAGEGTGGLTVYTLHGHALTVADTLLLDPGYLAYLEGARTHHHARVRALAGTEWSRSQTKNTAATALASERRPAVTVCGHESGASGSATSATEALQNSKRRSSSNKQLRKQPNQKKQKKQKKYNNNQNPAPNSATEHVAREAVDDQGLVFPALLPSELHRVAQGYLAKLPEDARQAVLDELAGRLVNAQAGDSPVRDPLRYLQSLCGRARRGEFVPNLGIAVRDRRERTSTVSPRAEAPAGLPERQEPADWEAALRVLAEIRESLGQSFRASTATPPSGNRKPPDR